MLEFFSEAGATDRIAPFILHGFCCIEADLRYDIGAVFIILSKDSECKALNSVRKGSVIYVIDGACSLFSVQFIFGLISIVAYAGLKLYNSVIASLPI